MLCSKPQWFPRGQPVNTPSGTCLRPVRSNESPGVGRGLPSCISNALQRARNVQPDSAESCPRRSVGGNDGLRDLVGILAFQLPSLRRLASKKRRSSRLSRDASSPAAHIHIV